MSRTTVYSEEKLLKIINDETRKNPSDMLSVKSLVEKTGISKNVWYRNKAAMDAIETHNHSPLMMAIDDEFEMPSVNDLYEVGKNDPTKMKTTLRVLLDAINKERASRKSLERKIAKLTESLETERTNNNALRAKLTETQRKLDAKQITDLNKAMQADKFASLFKK